MISDERSFVETYAQLLELAEKAPAGHFFSTAEYGKVQGLGPTLPPIDYGLPSKTHHDRTVSVTFKSIRPPKFAETLKISTDTTVYSTKTALIKHLGLDVPPENLKFLLKSKVLSDSAPFDVESGSSITVMVTAKKQEPVPMDEDPVEAVPESKPVVSAQAWSRILDVLREDVGEEAPRILEKMKAVVE